MIFHTQHAKKFFLKFKNFFILKFHGLFVFSREIFSNPTAMGAALPSSNRLARAIAKQIPFDTPGTIVELGPGTGVVTQALLDHGIHPNALVLIEKSEALANHLTKRFSGVHIIAGDAQYLNELLKKYDNINIVVSSLPLRSLPEAVVKNAIDAIDKKLAHGGLFIQFTYYQGSKPMPLPKTFQHIYSEHVVLNFPPAQIHVFSHT
jgi:phosphatidylethanolamine/phosphatidyl-N-methylethanolamine N-methyltransferase